MDYIDTPWHEQEIAAWHSIQIFLDYIDTQWRKQEIVAWHSIQIFVDYIDTQWCEHDKLETLNDELQINDIERNGFLWVYC